MCELMRLRRQRHRSGRRARAHSCATTSARRGTTASTLRSGTCRDQPDGIARRGQDRGARGHRRRARHREDLGALAGDLATDNDARRLARAASPVKRSPPARPAISTRRWCTTRCDRLASKTSISSSSRTSATWSARRVYDLGQACDVVALSVTEGEDKPLKYPTIFHKADLVL